MGIFGMGGQQRPAYHRVGSRGGDGSATGWSTLFARQGKVVIAFALSLCALGLYLMQHDSGYHMPSVPASSSSRPANLHIVIPADHPDSNLCKVLVSAGVLGYPSPVIINWGEDFSDPKLVDGGSHLHKISGIYEFVDHFDESHQDDLVLMVDGFDIWMQLRPQTLVDRYFAINRRADARARRDLGSVVDKYNIHQEIIFGCQKRCWPWSEKDPPCYAVPQSSLVSDIYGPDTDTDVGNKDNPYIKNRQRYLNSGVGIGTVRAMRKLFNQTLEQAKTEANFGSDQYIFSHVFGDQEVYREMLRRDALSPSERVRAKVSGYGSRSHFNPEHIEEVRKKAAARHDGSFEFGIGVDYGSEIGLNTVFAEDDTEWAVFSNETQLKEAQESRGIDTYHQRMNSIQKDIEVSVPPFWTFSNERSLPRWTKWTEVPLLTDVYTGITPAVIHHNAHRDGRKKLRETWWPLVWFQSHVRTLYDAYIYAPITPVAVSGYNESTVREWWPEEIWKGGARAGSSAVSSPDGWLRYDEICRDYHEEVFRDGKGPWELPANH
ncbi:hypothetical protein MBLNU230_g0902t1 [Neophaeotheca triangularis]